MPVKPIIRLPPDSVRLDDNSGWCNRFTFKISPNDKAHIISQNIKLRHFGCDCWEWKKTRSCKHLAALKIPAGEPFEAEVIESISGALGFSPDIQPEPPKRINLEGTRMVDFDD